jgi:hypothetical protein
MELLLYALAGWSALGAIGVALSLRLGQREKALRHGAWIAGVWIGYGAVLGGVSFFQAQRVVPIGKDQCFHGMCFAVMGVEPVEAVVAGETGTVIRVKVKVANHGKDSDLDGRVRAYLEDAQGRRWEPLPGLSGNALRSRVAGGSQMLSEPVFRVARDSTGLSVVFTHGAWQPGRLVIGDSDSLGHRPTIVRLGQ